MRAPREPRREWTSCGEIICLSATKDQVAEQHQVLANENDIGEFLQVICSNLKQDLHIYVSHT